MDASFSDSSIHLAKKESKPHFLSYITLQTVGLLDALKDLSYLQKRQLNRIHVSFIFIRTKIFYFFLGGEGWVGGGHEKCLPI